MCEPRENDSYYLMHRGMRVLVKNRCANLVDFGPCHFSPTGFHSFSGAQESEVTVEMLDAEAKRTEGERTAALREIRSLLKSGRKSADGEPSGAVSDFIHETSVVGRAFAKAVLAPQEQRALLMTEIARSVEALDRFTKLEGPQQWGAWTAEILHERAVAWAGFARTVRQYLPGMISTSPDRASWAAVLDAAPKQFGFIIPSIVHEFASGADVLPSTPPASFASDRTGQLSMF